MSVPETHRIILQSRPGDTGAGKLAYRHVSSKASRQTDAPDILFCGGLHSNMDGGKASFLHQCCVEAGIGFSRFDYRGHGLSDGRFADGTIGDWYQDAELVLDKVCHGRQVVVGSSMGAWMALLLAKHRAERIAGLVLIAPAPDFPRILMLPSLSVEAKAALQWHGVWHRPTEFEDDPYPITQRLIDESVAHELLDGPSVQVAGPVHILHGTDDEVVPLAHAQRVADWVLGTTVTLEVVDGGDHRLSEPADLERLWRTVTTVRSAAP